MNDKQRGAHLITVGMAGALAQAVSRVSMNADRAPTEVEVEFINNFADKTEREISDFCFDRGLVASLSFFASS